MAIKIPVRSSASESVGGKTIRIPRDRGTQAVNLPKTNLLSSVPNAIAPAFDQLTAFLDITSQRVKAHNDKIEAQRIKNKNTLMTANFASDVNQVLEDIKNSDELTTASGESYNWYWDDKILKLKTKYKKKYIDDDNAYDQWISDQMQEIGKGQVKMWKLRNDKVLAQAKVTYDLESIKITGEANDLLVTDAIWEKTALLTNEKLKSITEILKKDKYAVSNPAGEIQKIEMVAWQKILETLAGSFTNSDGEKQINYQNVFKILSKLDEGVDVNKILTEIVGETVEGEVGGIKILGKKNTFFGKKMTEDIRTKMLDWAKGKSEQQVTVNKAITLRNNKIIKSDLVNDLLKMESNQPDAMKIAENYAQRIIEWTDGSKEDKTTLMNAFLKWQKGDRVRLYETPAGEHSLAIATIIAQMGLADTETEKSFYNHMLLNDLIKSDDYIKLTNKVDSNILKKNQFKKPLYKSAISMLSAEIADRDLSRLLQNIIGEQGGIKRDEKGVTVVDYESLLGTKYSKEIYDTLNYFNLILGEGEKKGFSYVNMLTKKGHENYIMDDVLAFAKAAKDGKIKDNELTKEFEKKLWQEKSFEYDAPFNLSTEFWFEGKTPDKLTEKDIPVKKEDEGIFEYMMRVQNELKVMGIELPSTLTGKQFDKDFDINKVLIGIAE